MKMTKKIFEEMVEEVGEEEVMEKVLESSEYYTYLKLLRTDEENNVIDEEQVNLVEWEVFDWGDEDGSVEASITWRVKLLPGYKMKKLSLLDSRYDNDLEWKKAKTTSNRDHYAYYKTTFYPGHISKDKQGKWCVEDTSYNPDIPMIPFGMLKHAREWC